jgi:Tol biopolymer transport system component
MRRQFKEWFWFLLCSLLLAFLLQAPAIDAGMTLVSVDSDGNQGNGESLMPSVSADGPFVAFESQATNLVVGDTNGLRDIFVHDRETGTTTRVSIDSDGNQLPWESYDPSISADGRFVAFDRGGAGVYVHDRATGTTALVSVDSDGNQGNGESLMPSISGDGRFVAFSSSATNLVEGDTNGERDVFVYDRETGTTTRMNVYPEGIQMGKSMYPSINEDGRFVAYESMALCYECRGIYVHDRETGINNLISVDSEGNPGNWGGGRPSISGDGRFVAFRSVSTNLVEGDTNGVEDVFEYDRRLLCRGLPCTRIGSPRDDWIYGTPNPDVIHGREGDDIIYGLQGDDVICGGDGNDLLWGDGGDDVIYGGGGKDELFGGSGSDVIYGCSGKDKLIGNAGPDQMRGGSGNDTLKGGKDSDALHGGADVDICNGGSGIDTAEPNCERVKRIP